MPRAPEAARSGEAEDWVRDLVRAGVSGWGVLVLFAVFLLGYEYGYGRAGRGGTRAAWEGQPAESPPGRRKGAGGLESPAPRAVPASLVQRR